MPMSRKCSFSFLINSFVSTTGLGILIRAVVPVMYLECL